MTAPEAWVECPTCGGVGCAGIGLTMCDPCPDCSDGLVPSDGEVEAAALALWDTPLTHWQRDGARAALVAARRYQRKAGER